MVCDLGYLEDWEEKAHGLAYSIIDKGVCRTAPTTPGLFIIFGEVVSNTQHAE